MQAGQRGDGRYETTDRFAAERETFSSRDPEAGTENSERKRPREHWTLGWHDARDLAKSAGSVRAA